MARDVEGFLLGDLTPDYHVEWFEEIKVDAPKYSAVGMGDKDDDELCWLPKSLINSGEITIRKLSNGFEVKMPYWLAVKKELV